jgi:hypothetical protein
MPFDVVTLSAAKNPCICFVGACFTERPKANSSQPSLPGTHSGAVISAAKGLEGPALWKRNLRLVFSQGDATRLC